MYNSYSGKERTNSNEVWHRPQSAICRVEDELMEKSKRAVSHTTDPIEKLQLLCLSRGAAGIMVFGRVFRKMDDGSKRLNIEKIKNGIKKTGLDFSNQDADELFKRFNLNHRGYISLDEFLKEIRPPMSESRHSIVDQAFKKLDKAHDGQITIEEFKNAYSVECNPMYMNGDDSADKTLTNFLAHFEQDGVVDGKVTHEEFMDYYSGISVSIDNDCYFDLMMRQAFKL